MASALAACATPTEIVLVVDTDLASSEVGAFWIRVNGRCITAPGDTELPLTLGITPDGQATGIEVVAAALAPGADVSVCPSGDEPDTTVVSQRAQADFVAGERRVLFLTLERACVGQLCESDLTCRAGACASSIAATSAWTGVLPRLGGDDAGMDASVDSGSADAAAPDAGDVEDGGSDAGPLDGGPLDAGPVDAGPPDAGPPDAGCTSFSWLDAPLKADSAIFPAGGSCAADCGGANSFGADPQINIGVGVGIFSFSMPAGVTPADFTSGVVRTVRLSLSRSTGCVPCSRTAYVEARPMRTNWFEGTMVARSGANWCRRLAQTDSTCPTSIRWNAEGALGALDVGPAAPAVNVPTSVSTLVLDVPPRSFAGFATATELSIRVAPQVAGSALFVAASREGLTRGAPPALSIEVCR